MDDIKFDIENSKPVISSLKSNKNVRPSISRKHPPAPSPEQEQDKGPVLKRVCWSTSMGIKYVCIPKNSEIKVGDSVVIKKIEG